MQIESVAWRKHASSMFFLYFLKLLGHYSCNIHIVVHNTRQHNKKFDFGHVPSSMASLEKGPLIMANMVMPHILAVDDDPNILQMVSKYLTENDFRVSAVSTGEAMEKV